LAIGDAARPKAVVKIFKNRWFLRFATRQQIADAVLAEAIGRAAAGAIDADLGGGVIKQRIGRQGKGKSGGFRAVILFRSDETAFFVYGFAKNARDNIRSDELRAFRALAKEMLSYDAETLGKLQQDGTIIEVSASEKKLSQ
jgi:hypothetical protein